MSCRRKTVNDISSWELVSNIVYMMMMLAYIYVQVDVYVYV